MIVWLFPFASSKSASHKQNRYKLTYCQGSWSFRPLGACRGLGQLGQIKFRLDKSCFAASKKLDILPLHLQCSPKKHSNFKSLFLSFLTLLKNYSVPGVDRWLLPFKWNRPEKINNFWDAILELYKIIYSFITHFCPQLWKWSYRHNSKFKVNISKI